MPSPLGVLWLIATDLYSRKGSRQLRPLLSTEAKFQSFDAIVSSPANRALHTATLLAHEIGFPFSVFYLKEALYSFSARDVIHQVHQLDDNFDKVIVVGHNPAFSDAVDYFSVKPTPELKTADWISITFVESNWKLVTKGTAEFGSKKEALRHL